MPVDATVSKLTTGTKAVQGPESGTPPSMRRLVPHEIESYIAALREWQSWSDADVILTQIHAISKLYTVSQGRLQFWREAFVGLACAQMTHAVRFRLGNDPPDFELDYGDHIRSFEVVDVLPAGRLRGDEYDQLAADVIAGEQPEIEHLSAEKEREEYHSIPIDVLIQIQNKKAKKYDPSIILVMDLHHAVIHELYQDVEGELVRLARGALDAFAEIWFRKGMYLLRVSPYSVSRICGPLNEEFN